MIRTLPALLRALAPALAFLLMASLFAACDIDSVDSTTSVVSDSAGNIYDYSGLYMSASNSSGSTNGYAGLVFPAGKQSGVTLTWLRLLQYGSVLEGYDNAGITGTAAFPRKTEKRLHSTFKARPLWARLSKLPAR
jgi:hypothetical protein